MKPLLALAVLCACGGPVALDESGDEADLASAAAALAAYDPITSLSAAHKAAAALSAGALAVQLQGDRTPPADSMHTQPQPRKPLYLWTWTFHGSQGAVAVTVGPGLKPRARKLPQDSTTGLPVLDFQRVAFHPKDLYAQVVAVFPEETHHAFDQLVLSGAQAGQPQGWQALVYEQGDDDKLFFVDGLRGGASALPVD